MLAIIAARGGSKRLPRKNIKLLAGKPLLAYGLDAALRASSVDRVIVTTDDEEIAEVARKYGADVPFLRPAELATDTITARAACLHVVDWLKENEGKEITSFVQLQPTSPFITSQEVDGVVNGFKESGASAAVAITRDAPHIEGVCNQDKNGFVTPVLKAQYGVEPTIVPSQMHGPRVLIAGSIVVLKPEKLRENVNYLFSGVEVLGVEVSADRNVDIDTERDFRYAEWLMSEDNLQD